MFGSCDVGAVQTFLVCHRLLFWSSICLFCWSWRQEARAQGACFMHVYTHWEKEGEQTLPSFSVSLAHTHTGRSPASCIHPHTRTHTNTQTHTHIHTQTYVHTHSHTQVSCEKLDVFCIHFVSTHVEVCGINVCMGMNVRAMRVWICACVNAHVQTNPLFYREVGWVVLVCAFVSVTVALVCMTYCLKTYTRHTVSIMETPKTVTPKYGPPARMNHVKYLRAGPAEMPFQNWYTANTNHFDWQILSIANQKNNWVE